MTALQHSSPHCLQVTLVDFTVTMAGLEDQLLGKLILKEKHELEEQRQGLMEEVQSYRKKIKQLEDDLLFRLSNSQVGLVLCLTQALRCDGCGSHQLEALSCQGGCRGGLNGAFLVDQGMVMQTSSGSLIRATPGSTL